MNIRDLAARKVELKEQRARIDEELAVIDMQARSLGYGTHDAGEWSLAIQHNRTLDKERFMEKYPVAQFPDFYKPAVNTSAIKERIAPADLAAFYNEGDATVVVK